MWWGDGGGCLDIHRALEAIHHKVTGRFPALVRIGPHRSGQTSLLKHVCHTMPDHVTW
jgi:hypothetical protein